MKSFLDGAVVEAISSTVPGKLQKLDEDFLGITSDEIDKITKITGIKTVAISPNSVTSSDLCADAANVLLSANPTYKSEIEAVIFVSQSRDFLLPSTSSILQDKLELSKDCLCLDIPSGCTGYIHGLFLASSLIAANTCKKVLLLCGETNSKLINKRDRTVSMIFGDAGTATIIGRSKDKKSYYNFKTDGNGYDKIIVPHGGCRTPFSQDSLKEVEFENGIIRSNLDMKMDGMSVFNFAINSVPKLVKDSLEDCTLCSSDLNLFAAHQANQLIVNQLSKKCGFNISQSPFLAKKFGNTGPPSIPLLLSEGFSNGENTLEKVMMCGFGVGLNWGVCVLDLSLAKIYPTKTL